MFGYAPQRQILPLMNSFTSASSGPHGSVQQRHRRHDLPGCAIAALVGIAGNERSLHRVQVFRLTDTLNCRDLFALVHGGEAETRIHAPAIDVHSARTALAMIASLFRSGQMQMLSKTIEKRGARIDPQIVFLAVNPKRYRDSILRGR